MGSSKISRWALLLAHYAIRVFHGRGRRHYRPTIDLDPDRLSTIRAINIVRRSVTDPAAFSPCAQQQQRTRAISELLERLNPPRRNRTYPRVHKRGNRHNFPTKTTKHKEQMHHPTIMLQPRPAA